MPHVIRILLACLLINVLAVRCVAQQASPQQPVAKQPVAQQPATQQPGTVDLVTPISYPGSLECDEQVPEIELARFKKQALQSISLSTGWMADISGGGFSSSFLEASIGSGIPLGNFDNIVGVKPGFRVDWIQADPTIDVPKELYQFELQFFYRRPLRERLSAIAVISPSIRSDLTTSDDAFRVFALGLLNWECIPDRLILSSGVVFLGRADLPVLPALGVTWTPNNKTKLELRFPSSLLSYRIAKDGGQSETWAYLSAGLGGNTWSVTRNSSTTDELSLRDFRLTTGINKLLDGGGGWFVETGYAFARRIEYERDSTIVNLGDGFLIQGGWRY